MAHTDTYFRSMCNLSSIVILLSATLSACHALNTSTTDFKSTITTSSFSSSSLPPQTSSSTTIITTTKTRTKTSSTKPPLTTFTTSASVRPMIPLPCGNTCQSGEFCLRTNISLPARCWKCVAKTSVCRKCSSASPPSASCFLCLDNSEQILYDNTTSGLQCIEEEWLRLGRDDTYTTCHLTGGQLTGIIVGCVTAVILGIVIGMAVCWLYRRRCDKSIRPWQPPSDRYEVDQRRQRLGKASGNQNASPTAAASSSTNHRSTLDPGYLDVTSDNNYENLEMPSLTTTLHMNTIRHRDNSDKNDSLSPADTDVYINGIELSPDSPKLYYENTSLGDNSNHVVSSEKRTSCYECTSNSNDMPHYVNTGLLIDSSRNGVSEASTNGNKQNTGPKNKGKTTVKVPASQNIGAPGGTDGVLTVVGEMINHPAFRKCQQKAGRSCRDNTHAGVEGKRGKQACE